MNRITTEQFLQKCQKSRADYNNFDYTNTLFFTYADKIEIVCKIHTIKITMPPGAFLRKDFPCKECLDDFLRENFIKKGIDKFGKEKFDYSKVIYKDNKKEIIIICKDHGQFLTTANHFLRSDYGCQKCGRKAIGNFLKSSTEEFIKSAKEKYFDKFDYSQVEYIDCDTLVKIKCPIHNWFEQTPYQHLNTETGCKNCGAKLANKNITLKAIDNFIPNAILVHGDKYNYSKVIYTTRLKEVEIFCNKHQQYFWQKPWVHLAGHNCPRCALSTISIIEQKWLDDMNIPDDRIHRQIKIYYNKNKWFKVDGFDPSTNTIYEFNGDYWHGNLTKYNPQDFNKVSKQTFGELHTKTLAKEQALIQAGYKVISIWESDYLQQLKDQKLKSKELESSTIMQTTQ